MDGIRCPGKYRVDDLSCNAGENGQGQRVWKPCSLSSSGGSYNHIEGLDRELPKNRLYRGFGTLTLGGITGIAASAMTKSGKSTKSFMGGGAALCAVFAGLLFRGYKMTG